MPQGIVSILTHALVRNGVRRHMQSFMLGAALFLVAAVLLGAALIVGLAALAAAIFLALDSELPPAAAAGITAAVFLLIAACAIFLAWWRLRRTDASGSPNAAQASTALAEAYAAVDKEISRARATIDRQPVQSVLTAAVLGIVTGMLIDRK